MDRLANGLTAATVLLDPTTKYPGPPWKKQTQPWPGLACKMEPPPDHGEKSYKGSGRLTGRKGAALPGDLRDETFCRKLVEDAVAALGGLDIVVSNAARQQAHDCFLDISSEDFDATMKTNIYAPFWILKAAVPHLKPDAAIIATTSEQAYDPDPISTTMRRPRRRR